MLKKIILDPLAPDSLEVGARKLNTALQVLDDTQLRVSDILRDSIHSGLLGLDNSIGSAISGTSGGRGQLQAGLLSGNYYANRFGVRSFNAIINGNKLFIDKWIYANVNELNYIDLTQPPTFGTRDDLIFLETWFPQDDSEKMSWRIRVVEGVDFTSYPLDGFTKDNNIVNAGNMNLQVAPQGGLNNPNIGTVQNYLTVFQNYKQRSTSSYIEQNDVGLYIAGNGNQLSKDTLKTADGYVYAIPLFRVKRRNSGGYREDNLNGADNYVSGMVNYTNVGNSKVGVLQQVKIDSILYDNIIVGDTISVGSTDTSKVVSKDGNALGGLDLYITTIGLYAGNGTTNTYYIKARRPDLKFANIIDKDDIIDLRHKVSLTGYNYNKLLAENFDKFMRGELSSDKPVMAKERFGLMEAPKDTMLQLIPTKVKGNDGVERDLVNLLGSDGNCESIANITTNATMTIDSDGKNGKGIKILGSGSNGNYYGYFPNLLSKINTTKNYLVIADVKFNSGGYGAVYVEFGATFKHGTQITSNTYAPSYAKVSASELIGATTFIPRFKHNTGTVANSYSIFDEIRVYEIDQATYDKIDVDPLYTGEELGKKFPYVSSYQNICENIVSSPIEYGRYDSGSGASVDTAGRRSKEFNAVAPSTLYKTKLVNFTTGAAFWVLFYDINKNRIDFSDGRTSFTTPSNCYFVKFYSTSDDKDLAVVMGRNLDSLSEVYTPYGRWLLPNDYAQGLTPTRLKDTVNHVRRQAFSDAQTSETYVDFIDPVSNSHLPHIKTTQATAGVWAVNDTIKVSSLEGVVSGVIDADTAIATTLETIDITSGTLIKLDKVIGIAINDVITFIRPEGTVYSDKIVTSVDSVNNTITINGSLSNLYAGSRVYETTASTSSPVTTANGLVGTWTNLGTKEATFTITTAPTTNTSVIQVQYSTNYTAGKGLSYLPSEVLGAKVNGLNYVKSNTLKLVENLDGKIVLSTSENPHEIKFKADPIILETPSNIQTNPSQVTFTTISKLDGSLWVRSTSVVGGIAQSLFSFNIIEAVERSYGRIPKLTLAEKIQWIKDNVTSYNGIWSGFGSSVGGNKATVAFWSHTSLAWTSATSHSNSTVSSLNRVITLSSANAIDANGFVYFIAYAEPSDGTTPSIINSDYMELEILINVAETGYDTFVPDITKPLLVDSPEMFVEGENMITPLNIGWGMATVAQIISPYEWKIPENTAGSSAGSAIYLNVSPNTNYAFNVDSNLGRSLITGVQTGTTLSALGSVSLVSSKLFNSGQNTTIAISLDKTSSNLLEVYFKNPMLTLGNVIKPFVPFNKFIKRRRVLDLKGKIEGSSFENPHVMKYAGRATFESPLVTANYINAPQSWYTNVDKLDGALRPRTSSTEGTYSQHLFEFDLSHLGLSLVELKLAIKKMSAKWTGYGVGDNTGVITNGATTKWWVNTTNAWVSPQTNVTSVPSLITASISEGGIPSAYINKEQKVYMLVHSTYPAGAASPSEIYTDYISLEVELAPYVDQVKKNVIKVRPVTKEIKTQYPRKSVTTGREDVIELFYKHLPQEPKISTSMLGTILAESDGLLLSDLSSSVGNKQGIHHYMNPLYRVSNDILSVFGDIGFGNAPFAADSKGINVGTKVQFSVGGLINYFTTQYAILSIKKPMLGIVRFLVLQDGELKMLIITSYSTAGAFQIGNSTGNSISILVPIEGKILSKEQEGNSRTYIPFPTAWRTPNGEIQGYLNDQGKVITT